MSARRATKVVVNPYEAEERNAARAAFRHNPKGRGLSCVMLCRSSLIWYLPNGAPRFALAAGPAYRRAHVGLNQRFLRHYANRNYFVWEATLFVVKILFSVALLLAAAEIAKRSTFFGALIIALPLTSMLAMAR